MGLTISFIFCLLSGLFAFWLFWKMWTGLKRFKKERELCIQHYLYWVLRFSGI